MLQNIREEKEHIAGAKHHMNDSSTFPVVMWPLRYNGIKACLIPGNKLYPETAMVKIIILSDLVFRILVSWKKLALLKKILCHQYLNRARDIVSSHPSEWSGELTCWVLHACPQGPTFSEHTSCVELFVIVR